MLLPYNWFVLLEGEEECLYRTMLTTKMHPSITSKRKRLGPYCISLASPKYLCSGYLLCISLVSACSTNVCRHPWGELVQ